MDKLLSIVVPVYNVEQYIRMCLDSLIVSDELMDQFLRQMLVEKGVDDVSEEVFNQIVSDLKERLIFYINRAIIAELPAEQRIKLDNSLEGGTATAESINALVDESGLNTEPIIQQVMIDFKEKYLKGEMPTDEDVNRG